MRNEIEESEKDVRSGDSLLKTKRTIEEVVAEIKKIIDIDLEQDTMLTRLRNKGFEVEHCWVKNGNIGDIYYMKRKNVYRIQVADSELHGKFDKAYCVILEENDVQRPSDKTKVRNMFIKKS